jgi:hypothetical protein
MAPRPRDPGPISPDVIDFKFSIVGEGFLEAANSLVNQMSELQGHLQQFGTSPEQASAAARRATGKRAAGIQHGSHAYTSTPPPIQPEQQSGGGGASTPPGPPTTPGFPGGEFPARGTLAYDLWVRRTGTEAWLNQKAQAGGPSTPPDTRESSFGGDLAAARSARGGQSHPPDEPEPTRADRLSRMGFLRRLGQYREEGRGVIGGIQSEVEVTEAREQRQWRERGGVDYQNPSISGYTQPNIGGVGRGSGSGGLGPSPGASLPTGNANDPLWLRGLRSDPARYERGQETWSIPQFGEMTWQNKLDIGADWLQRSAVSSYDTRLDRLTSQGMSHGQAAQQLNSSGSFGQGVGGFRGYGSNLLRMGADNAVKAYLGMQMFRGGFDRGRGLSASGTSLGYGRGDSVTIPGTDIGFMLPGQGTSEGLRQRWTSTRLRLRSGISGSQANEIVGSLAQNGFSGSEGNDVALNYISDLVRQGQDPEQASNLFSQAVRNGNASMSEVAKTLNDLGDAARTARQTLGDYMEGLNQFSERAQQSGALKGPGLALGRSVTQSLGISGQQAAEVFDSPIMQATMMRDYGILPNEIGNLSSTVSGRTSFTTGMLDSIDRAMTMAAPFAKDQVGPDGKVIVSGKDRQIAQAAQFMKMSRETFERLLRGKDQSRNLIKAQGALETFSDQVGPTQSGTRFIDGATKPGDWIPAVKHAAGAVNVNGTWMQKATAVGDAGHYEVSGALAGGSQSWDAAKAALAASAPTDGKRAGFLKQVEDISNISDPKRRIAAAEGLISRAQKAASSADQEDKTVYVQFKGTAGKVFEQYLKKDSNANRNANAGGTSRNKNAAGYNPDRPAPPGFGP